MAPKAKTTKPSSDPEPPIQYTTIGAKLEAEYLASRPYQVLKDTKGLSRMTAGEQAAYATYRILDTGVWKGWSESAQKEFLRTVELQKVPLPLSKPEDLGKDGRGREIKNYSVEEYAGHLRGGRDLQRLRRESAWFREGYKNGKAEGEIEEEKNRRKVLGLLRKKKMGLYEGNPVWDDVVPIPQDDGEGALAQIAYTDEYAEAMGYLRAIMAAKEHSSRVLDLTEHIISLNAAHYTVWLYRASTLFALQSSLADELAWVNQVALAHEKNYQIWHHRQLLIDHLYATDLNAASALAESERDFMGQMFAADAKNYHVWSYRQYLVRKLELWDKEEIADVETLLREDVRNNSAWSHRFFVVFSNPKYTTPGSPATSPDERVPRDIIERELGFAKAATYEAPQNQSPWNYLRGVLRKGGRALASEEEFVGDFVKLGEDGEEEVRSSHALEFMADVWAEKGETERAGRAWGLLGSKYDRVRKGYWEWRRKGLAGIQA